MCVARFQRFFLLLSLTAPGGSLCVCGDRNLFGWAWHAAFLFRGVPTQLGLEDSYYDGEVCFSKDTTVEGFLDLLPKSLERLFIFFWVLLPLYFVGIPVHTLLVDITLVPMLISTATFW